ncbi:ABC transporter permease [Methylobacterium sp. 17Sr1-1]|uniref:ABC transporter permease n=1 Tax=Methylobacterium sp. 17Sr1-1 TaxID=2202826 RepID=UPI00268F5E2E
MTALAWPARGIAASLHRRLNRHLHRHLAPIALGLLVPLGLLVAWAAAAASGWLPEQILPAPRIVAETLVEMVRSGELAQHAGISGLRVLAGFSLGAGFGLLLGGAMGLSRRVEDAVSPLFTALAQVPTLGWIPLLMLFLGIGETLKIVVIAKAALVPVTLNTAAGIRAIPEGYREVARAYRFTRVQTLRRLILPASVPPVFTGIRYGLTKAWTALVAVELLASAEGLGYLLVWGRQMFWLDTMIVAMALIGLVGVAMDAVLARIEARLQLWRIDAR